jgi:hypothetical protein
VGYVDSCTAEKGPSVPRLKSRQANYLEAFPVSDPSVKPRTKNSINSKNFRTIQNYFIKSNYQIRKGLLQTGGPNKDKATPSTAINIPETSSFEPAVIDRSTMGLQKCSDVIISSQQSTLT